MQNETIVAVIITSVISPTLVRFLEFAFGSLSNSKNKSTLAIEKMGEHIVSLEKQITEMKDTHAKEMIGMRESLEREHNTRYDILHKEIEAVRSENVKLQIKVAENEVKLTLKDETIARLTNIIQEKKPSRKSTPIQ